MSYELIHNTTRRAPKVTIPSLAKAYRKLPKEDERMSIDPIECLEDLLDEHGVDYAWDGDSIYWNSLDGVPWTVERRHDGNLALYSPKCTSRQAVDATLGSYENELLRNKIADYDKRYTHLCEQLASVKRSLAAACDAHAAAERHIEEVEAENDKLRELVDGMAYCLQHGRECDGCRLNGADGTITAPVGCDGLLDRMRDLGIEVDE